MTGRDLFVAFYALMGLAALAQAWNWWTERRMTKGSTVETRRTWYLEQVSAQLAHQKKEGN